MNKEFLPKEQIKKIEIGDKIVISEKYEVNKELSKFNFELTITEIMPNKLLFFVKETKLPIIYWEIKKIIKKNQIIPVNRFQLMDLI